MKMNKLMSLVTVFGFCMIFTIANAQDNQLTQQEKKGGWELLFDGKTTKGWHTYLKPSAEPAWSVVDGTLQLNPKAEGQGDLVTAWQACRPVPACTS